MKKILSKQLTALSAYLDEAFENKAHIGLLFFVVVTILGVSIYKTM